MGLRGPKPKPKSQLKSPHSYRPIDHQKILYKDDIPEPPKTLSKEARFYWDRLIADMASGGVLRVVDWVALSRMCEDEALLDRCYEGIFEAERLIAEMLKTDGKMKVVRHKKARGPVPKLKTVRVVGNPLMTFFATTEGNRAMGQLHAIANRLLRARDNFGLTPYGRIRIAEAARQLDGEGLTPNMGKKPADPLESKLAGDFFAFERGHSPEARV